MKKIITLITAIAFFNACASSTTTSNPPKTQLQVREFQTKYFEVNDKNIIMKAVVNTLLDEGYIIKNASYELGLVTAEKGVDITSDISTSSTTSGDEDQKKSSNKAKIIAGVIIGAIVLVTVGLIIWLVSKGKKSDSGSGSGSNSSNSNSSSSQPNQSEKLYEKNRIIESTINVSEFSNGYKVRAVFQYKGFDNKGNLMYIKQIDDMNFYQEFFAKLDKSVFLQKEYENK